MRPKTISVTRLTQSIIYQPLAAFLAIVLMPVFSVLQFGPGPKAFQASASPSPAPTGTIAPTTPGSLTASWSQDLATLTASLTWTASADPASPTITYHVEFGSETVDSTGFITNGTGFNEIATTTLTSYSDTDRPFAPDGGTTFFYRVRAADSSGNYSGYSNIVQYPAPTNSGGKITQTYDPCVQSTCYFSYAQDLVQLESDAVNAYLAEHDLPATDAHIIYDDGRPDLRNAIRGNMLSILLGIITKASSSRTTHEQNLYNWLQLLIQGNEINLYTAAISQYNAWQANQCGFTLDPQIASAINASYDGTPWCEAGFSELPPAPTVPPQGYFIAYGIEQSYALPAYQYPNFPSLTNGTALSLNEVMGVATAADTAIFAAIAGGALAASFVAADAGFLGITGIGLAASDLALALLPTVTSAVTALGSVALAAGPLAIILIAVVIGVSYLIDLLNYDNTIAALNGMSATLSLDIASPPDLAAMATDPTGIFKINQTLVSQTLPDNPSTATLPAHQSTDPLFAITPQGFSQTVSPTLAYQDWAGINWSAQTYGGWFVQTCSSATGCPQADSIIGSINYVDWSGVKRIASRFGNNFVVTLASPASTDVTCPADQTTGLTISPASNCLSYVTNQIQLMDPNGIPDTVTLTTQASTTTTVSANTITYDANGSVTVTVSSSGGTPTGDVSLSVDGGAATSQTLDGNGSATFTIGSPNAGTHTLSASYAAQGNFGPSSGSGSLQVNQASDSASINAPAVTYNANGAVTVTVSSSAGTPAGSVSLSVDGGSPSTQTLDGTGAATFTITSPNAASHTLSASYAAQGNFAATGATGTLQVIPASTGMTVSAPTVTYPANGTVTVQTTSAAGIPTGSVSLTVDGGAPMTMPVDATGKAQFTISSPGIGNHSLSASYALQGNFAATGATGTLLVIAPTTLTISAPAVTYNANGSVTLTVTSPSGTPTGTVSLSVDGGSATSQALNSSAQATFTIASPGAGPHSLSASYTGNFNPSIATGTLSVNLSPTITSITSGLTAATVTGQGYNVGVKVAAVAPGAGTPTGTVIVSDGSASCIATLSGGSGTCTLTSTTAVLKTVTATYNSDGNYLSTSTTGAHTVNKASTGLIVASSETPATFGDSVVLTASLSVKTPGSGTPTGAISWTIDGQAAGTGSTLTIATLPVGTHTVSASYPGDLNYSGSSGSLANGQKVNAYPVVASLSAPSQQYSGQETFTISVPDTVVNGQTATTAGSVVTFYVGTQKMGACTLTASGGVNTCSLTAALIEPSATAAGVPTGAPPNGQMAPGNHTVTVNYTVDSNFSVTGNSAMLSIAQENATSVYTGNTFYSLGTATRGTFVLSATIQDPAATTSDPAYGDIRNARVTFVDRLTGNVFSGCANLPVGLIASSNSTLGSASCTTTVAPGTYQVATLVGYSNASTVNNASYYSDNNPSEDTSLTVAQTGAGLITGGGFLQLTKSSGQLNPTNNGTGAQSHQNFGFIVASNKSQTNLPGYVSAIVRSQVDLHGNACSVSHAGHTTCVYQVNSTEIGSLTVVKAPNALCPANTPTGSECASFTSSAVITDVTLPFSSTTIDGNATIIVNVVDTGKPSTDMISFQVNAASNKGGGLWYSSNWTGTRTAEQGLAEGGLSAQ